MPHHNLDFQVQPALDRHALTKFLDDIGGDTDALSEVLLAYLQDADGQLAKLKRGVADSDARALGAAAHTFKSTSGSVGASRLSGLCAELMAQAKGGFSPLLAETVAHIDAEFTRVHALIAPPESAPPDGENVPIDIAALLERIR